MAKTEFDFLTEGYHPEDQTTPYELSLCRCDICPFKPTVNPKIKESFEKYKMRIPVGPVPGMFYGNTDTEYKIVVVGIYAADVEVKTGFPFTGTSGRILKETMNQLGYTGYYLTNVMLCEKPKDVESGDEDRAIACCLPRLEAEISRHCPDLVVALGNIPAGVLLNTPGKITSLAGRVFPGKFGPTLAAIHPAAFQKSNPDGFRDFTEQIDEGLRSLQGSYQQINPPNITIVNEDNFSEVLNRLDKYPFLVLDLETTRNGLYPYGDPPDGVRCLVIAPNVNEAYIFPGESSIYYPENQHPNFVDRKETKEFLRNRKLITHNGQFDIAFLLQLGFTDLNLFYDTMLAHIQLDERVGSHGLKALARKYLGAPDWESDIKIFLPTSKSSYDLIPDSKLYTYAAMDVVCTYMLYERFKEKINSGIFKDLIMPCANMFSQIRQRGIPVDIMAIMQMDDILDEELEEELQNLGNLVGGTINPNSSGPEGEVAHLVYDILELPVIKRYGRSTAKAALSQYESVPVVQSILRCRQISKLKSTYVVGLAKFVVDRKIHPITKLYGAVTGRLSTEDPSVMNITKKGGGGIKRIYVPYSKDHYLAELDQKQMELRCYCCTTNDQKLIQLLNESKIDKMKDPHRLVSYTAFGEARMEDMRTTAKAGVFGRLYGRGLESFIYGMKMTKPEAINLIAIIDSMFPGVTGYNETIKEEIHSKGYLESFFGRKRRFPLITRENKSELYRQGSNFKIQSMASDVNLYCMLHLYGMRHKLGIEPLFPVHDSILFDIADPEVIPLLKSEMETFSGDITGNRIEFVEEAKFGRNWGDLKDWK